MSPAPTICIQSTTSVEFRENMAIRWSRIVVVLLVCGLAGAGSTVQPVLCVNWIDR
jgi:hypothetical protein